jgi:hypothetical protein
MKLPRREFLKTSLAASAATALSATGLRAASTPTGAREYYDLRSYRVKAGGATEPIDGYLEKALLPALGKRGVKNVGVFTEIEIVDRNAATSKPKVDSPVWVLIPHASLASFESVSAEINADADVQKAGADYLQVPKASAAYERIDTWLLNAFKSMPKIEVPAFSASKAPNRVFEMRSYESYSEAKALAKMAMFDEGETPLMRDIGMSPVFFGQALAGPNLPHLTYITSAIDLATHLNNWKKFLADPRWLAMRDLPQYKDSVSKNVGRFLVSRPYSQL